MKNIKVTYDAIWGFEEKDYIAIEFPNIPGCISCAFSGSEDEALYNSKEALLLMLDGLKYSELPKRDKVECGKDEKVVPIEVEITLDGEYVIDYEGHEKMLEWMDRFATLKFEKEQQTEYIAVKDTFSYDKLNRWYFEMLEKVGLDDEWYDFATEERGKILK